MGLINQVSRKKYWATHSSVPSFARTAHSFACSGLLASLAPSASLTHLLAHSLSFAHYLARGTLSDWMSILSVFFLFSTIVRRVRREYRKQKKKTSKKRQKQKQFLAILSLLVRPLKYFTRMLSFSFCIHCDQDIPSIDRKQTVKPGHDYNEIGWWGWELDSG